MTADVIWIERLPRVLDSFPHHHGVDLLRGARVRDLARGPVLGDDEEELPAQVVRVALDNLFVVEVGGEGRKFRGESGNLVGGGAAAEFGDRAAVFECLLGWWW